MWWKIRGNEGVQFLTFSRRKKLKIQKWQKYLRDSIQTYSCNLELDVIRLSNFSNCSLVQRRDFERSCTGSQGSCLMYLKQNWASFFKNNSTWNLFRMFTFDYSDDFSNTIVSFLAANSYHRSCNARIRYWARKLNRHWVKM